MRKIIQRVKNRLSRIVKTKKEKRDNLPIKKNPDTVKWGVIGTGNMAKVFVKALNKSKDDDVKAVLSRNLERASEFAKMFHIHKCFSDLKEFLSDSEIDVVYIATPLETHFHYIKASLIAGKNVVCEKPLVKTPEEVSELEELAMQKNCFLMEGLWSKLLPTYSQALAWIKEGRIGRIESIKIEKARLKNYTKSDKKILSVMWDYGIYPISFVQQFLKAPKILHVSMTKNPEGLDTDWLIIMEENTTKAFVSISGRYAGESKAYIIGTTGTIEFGEHFNRSNEVSLYDLSRKKVGSYKYNYESGGFEYEIREVNRIIREGEKKSGIVTLKDTKETIRMMKEIENYRN